MRHRVTTAQGIDELACTALQFELNLPLKPGLVCPQGNGSHHDMNFHTFERSIAALKGYFGQCFDAGFEGLGLAALQVLGRTAESKMMKATGGVNTHRGAVYMLGLLSAAAGSQYRETGEIQATGLGGQLVRVWGAEVLLDSMRHHSPNSHGLRVKAQLRIPGARQQALAGFPAVFDTTLPALLEAHRLGTDPQRAGLHALLHTMAVLPDSNLAHRGGLEGLQWAQAEAAHFVASGSVFQPGWQVALQAMCDQFEARWLSPGGSADCVGAAHFLLSLARETSTPGPLSDLLPGVLPDGQGHSGSGAA